MNEVANNWIAAGNSGNKPAQGVEAPAAMPMVLHYWRIAVRWKWVIAAVVAVCLAAGLLITMFMTPKYTASATIEIARQQDKVLEVDDVKPESSFVDQEFYQTQYSLLQARTLAESIVDDLKLATNDRFFALFGVDPDKEGFFSAASGGKPTREQLANRRRVAADILLKYVSISPVRSSRLVTVSFTSPDAALSMQIANAWTTHFIQASLARRFEATSYARKFLEQRLEQLRGRLEDSERALVAYASSQRIINIPSSDTSNPKAPRTERPLVADDLSALNAALAEATADRIRAESRPPERGGVSSEALANQAIAGMRERRAQAAADYAKMLAQFEPGYPPAQALAAQVAELDRSIAREEARVGAGLSGLVRAAREREASLKARVESLKSGLLDQRRRSIQYNIYERDVDTNRQLYDGLLQRYKEIGVAGGIGSNNISIVDPAQLPERPSSPRLVLNMALALFLGLALGGGIALLLEQIDEGVKDPQDIANVTALPMLGTIPIAATGETPLELLADRKSAQSEAYLSIRTSLQFSTSQGVPRSIALTSTRPGEGKSTSAFAIAQSLARTDRAVILVDCDMRSPSVHHLLGLSNDKGLSNFLSGDDNIEAIARATGETGLSAMAAGPAPPNAGELLSGSRLELLIERLLERYDHVILDCPPVVGLADALLVASKAQGTVYVVEAHGVRTSVIRAALARLRTADVNLLGVVLTKFEARKAHYGYGYEYGYGYGGGQKA